MLISFTACVLLLTAVGSGKDLRHVDFKNFSYKWIASSGWQDKLEWLPESEASEVRLVNRRWAVPEEPQASAGRLLPFLGLTFESRTFGNLTGDGREEAIVVLRYDSGGTQYWHYVYIYEAESSHPRLLAYFHTGDRATSGLYRVYAQGAGLVVELFDPREKAGDGCSSRFIRSRYWWSNGTFGSLGPVEFGVPKTASRLPVSTFGVYESLAC
jgi:hypothetical protein